jgi:hypothetical protein
MKKENSRDCKIKKFRQKNLDIKQLKESRK